MYKCVIQLKKFSYVDEQMILDQASVGQNAPAILTRPVDHNGIVAGTQAVHGSETSTVVGP